MSDKSKYYYLKLKDNYFDQDSIKVIESLENGHIYSLIILKLYLKSCKYDGQLRMNHNIPYSSNREELSILANVINHDIDHLEKAIQCALKFGLITIIDQDELWMTEIQNFIGKSSTEADRIREYRKKFDTTTDVQKYDESTPERERELEKEIKKEVKQKKRFTPPTNKEVNQYIKEKFPDANFSADKFIAHYESNGWMVGKNKMKDWKAAVKKWYYNELDKKKEVEKKYPKMQEIK